jgi:hypothetical protein
MNWQVRLSKEHKECVKKQRQFIDEDEIVEQKLRKKIGKKMVNQSTKQIEGSLEQGHQPMRVRSFRQR